MMRRRRSLFLKLVIVFAVFYIGFLLIVGRGVSDGNDSSAVHVSGRQAPAWTTAHPGNDRPVTGDVRPPVFERPDFDRLRFEEKMHKDAEEEQLRRQRLEDKKRRHDEERRRRAMDRKPIPFREGLKTMSNNLSVGVQAGNGQLLRVDAGMQALIDQGLVVPKWNVDKEMPAVPGGPGM